MRINSHQVIQMVSNTEVVFVENRNGVEVVRRVAELPGILASYESATATGVMMTGLYEDDEDGLRNVFVLAPEDFDAVKKALEYFIECSKVSTEEQIKGVTVVGFDSVEQAMQHLGMVARTAREAGVIE